MLRRVVISSCRNVRTAVPAVSSSSVAVATRVKAAMALPVNTPVETLVRSFSSVSVAAKPSQRSSRRSRVFVAAAAVAGGVAASLLLSSDGSSAHAAGEAVDYKAVRQDIQKILDEDDNMGPTFVRLAWHASGTYDKSVNNGGSDGATMRFQPEAGHGANYGLGVARHMLERVKKAHPGISNADLWTLAAVTAIEYMGGPAIPWRAGRSDAADRRACPPDGRLPAADKGSKETTIQHIRDIFYRMGFNDREIVALAGAHALGRCHQDRSGYDGPWTRSPTTFSNQYFKELLETKWELRKWEGPAQYQDPTGDLMMLPADMAFTWDPQFKQYVELYARDEKVFFDDFSKAFNKLTELGVRFADQKPASKGWWPFGGSK